jgi:aldehyde:ferredoxin oxidoreductase
LESKLFSAVTGIDTDETGLHLYGERVFNLQRAILLREGWKPLESDTPKEKKHFKISWGESVRQISLVLHLCKKIDICTRGPIELACGYIQ